MAPSSLSATRSAGKKRARLEPSLRAARLNAAMSCGVAFQVIARRYLGDLSAKHEATCKGDPRALHEMRIALTHLRTAILFFSPMLGDGERTKLRHELKWLNAQLGAVRDLDVAIERLPVITKETSLPATGYEVWYEKATAAHGDLARVLRSA